MKTIRQDIRFGPRTLRCDHCPWPVADVLLFHPAILGKATDLNENVTPLPA
jgi:hypothetical protein